MRVQPSRLPRWRSLGYCEAKRAQPARKIKLGVVGCGGHGAWIANLFREHGGYEMHAIADYFPDVAEAAGQKLGVERARCFSGLSGYQKLIRSGVEAVALETPPSFSLSTSKQQSMPGCTFIWPSRLQSMCRDACKSTLRPRKQAPTAASVTLVDYQMPTDPHDLECANRFREGAFEQLGIVKSFYYGGLFGDPPLTDTIAHRLRSLVWVNDTSIGGSYHVNACIHPIQAMMWVLGKTPVAAAGISRIARSDPHGDSHDMYGITYEFADGLLWTHTGRHSNGLTGPDDPLATCEFLGSAYMKIGYGGRELLRGGRKPYAGGAIDNLYAAGATGNIATFHRTSRKGMYRTKRCAWPSTVV